MEPTQNQNPAPVEQPSAPIIQPQPPESPTPSTSSTPQNSSIKIVGIILVVVLVIAAVLYFVLPKKSNLAKPQSFNDSSLRVKYAALPSTSENSAAAFAGVTNNLSQADVTKIYTLISSSTPAKLPAAAESKKIFTTYADLVKVFEANAEKPYECNSLYTGKVCPLGNLRDASYIGSLRSLAYLQEGKTAEAQKAAQRSVAFGKNITDHASDLMTLLVGWISQKVGYTSSAVVSAKTNTASLSAGEKKALIDKLRAEHKIVLKHIYSNAAFGIDLINAPDDSASLTLTEEEKANFALYRKARIENPKAWDAHATKKYFYDSTEKMLKNVDAACGTVFEDSMMDVGYDQGNPQSENFIGKTLYVTGFGSFDSLNERRCEVEAVISKL